jgi:hypothetical protein
MSFFYLENDHSIELLGLRKSTDRSFVNDGTVTCTIYESDKTTEVGGLVFPLAMGYVNPGSNTVGGEPANPTVVKSCSKWNMEVTVGATNNLDLPAGSFIQVLHSEIIWRVIRAATGNAATDAVLHLEPYEWPVGDDEEVEEAKPTAVSETVGEIVELVDGIYRATLDKALSITDRKFYYAKVTVTEPGGLDGSFLLKAKAAYRL